MSITSQESHNMNNDHLTHWDVIAQSQPIISKLCHKNYKQGSISLAHQGRSTIFLDSIIQCLHRLKGILNNYEVVYDNDVFQYNAAFYDKWMRLSDFNDRDDAIEFVKKMDAKIVVAIADILNIVSAKNIHTKTSGLGHTVRNGEVMPNHYYSSRSDGMEVSLHYISLCIHKYISVLTQSERKFFIQHIQVDFDKGEKPVYFGGCFQTRVETDKQTIAGETVKTGDRPIDDVKTEVCVPMVPILQSDSVAVPVLRYKKNVLTTDCKDKDCRVKKKTASTQLKDSKIHKKELTKHMLSLDKKK